MTEQIKKIDSEHIAVIETNVNEQLIAKVTLEAQKVALLEQIAEIDRKLTYF
jgi:hypothetical protein